MANVSRINGFRPVKYLSGQPYYGACNMYSIDATDATIIAVGDLVKLDGLQDSTTGLRQVTRATVSAAVLGPVVGFKVDAGRLNVPESNLRAASTQRYVFVADDPNLVFEAQANAAITSALIGNNADITIAAASTITGMSAMQVDASTTATTNTVVLKLLDFVQRVDNSPSAASNKVLVLINNHQLAHGAGSTGV